MFGTDGRRRTGRAPQRTGLERLDLSELQFATELPEGRALTLPGRGTTFVREAAGPVGAPVVVLVHGLLASADLNWSLAIPALAAHYRVVAPDLRGHGDGIRTRRFDGDDCADDLAAIVETLGLGGVDPLSWTPGGCAGAITGITSCGAA